ncbi:signal peptidase I [Candidatus Izemoplasma sp. B36]|uniref:signal peptidase I n=1 Tax=Candidatus Izemoplasma sp. B36 TaxID=3242468 RepID=UPI00355835F9
MKKILKTSINLIPYIMLVVSFILIIQVAFSIKKGEVPSVFGKSVLFVETNSMEPAIMTNDMIFVDTNADEFHVGDIISFHRPDQPSLIITHRIIEIKEIDGVNFYTTLGDNNNFTDDWETDFSEDYIVGKYLSKSGFLGGIYQFAFSQGISLLFISIIIIFLAIGGMELYSIIKTLNQAKDKKMLEEKEKMIEEELEKLRKQKQEMDKDK